MIKFIDYFKERNKIQKQFEKDEDGRAIVNISISDKGQILSPFCYEGKETINDEFAGFLDNVVKSIPPKQNINLTIDCKDITDYEKGNFALAIKNHYQNKLIDTQLRIKKLNYFFAACILLSALSLGLLYLVNYLAAPFILIEIVDILAWVFVWEAVDIFFFQEGLLRLEKTRCLALIKSKIRYV